MPTAWIRLRSCTCRADSPAPPEEAAAAAGRDAGGQGHVVLLGDRPPARAADLALDLPLAHHQHPVADADHLGQLGGDHDHPDPLLRQLVDDPVDLRLGADVDPAGRLVEDQHLGADLEPARQEHLLLVAARQAADPDQRAGGAHPQRLERRLGPAPAAGQVEHAPAARVAVDHAHVDVLAARHVEEQPEPLAVLGQVGDAELERLFGPADGHRPAVEPDLARGLGIGAVDQPGELGPARADQPGDAQNLALVQLEAARLDPPAAVGHAADLEDHRPAAAVRVVLLFVEAGQIAADHHLDQGLGAELGALEHPGIAAVAQHRDPVGQLVDLGHAVADVDQRDALGAQLADQREQPLGLARREGRGRLVEHQDLGPGVQGAGDLDQLLLGDRQRADRGLGPERRAQALEHRPAAGGHRLAVDQAAAVQLGAEMDVLGHAQVGGEAELLVDDRDAVALGGDRVGDLHRHPVDLDRAARVGLVGAGEDLHQGRLAGAVLAHQRQHLATPRPQLDPVQRPHSRKRLRDPNHLQRGNGAAAIRGHARFSLIVRCSGRCCLQSEQAETVDHDSAACHLAFPGPNRRAPPERGRHRPCTRKLRADTRTFIVIHDE